MPTMTDVPDNVIDEATAVANTIERDAIASLLDSQADAGNEDADAGIYTLDALEAYECGVNLDARPDESRLS